MNEHTKCSKTLVCGSHNDLVSQTHYEFWRCACVNIGSFRPTELRFDFLNGGDLTGVCHSETVQSHTFNCLPATAANDHGYFVYFWRDGILVGVEEVEHTRHHAQQAASMRVVNTPSMSSMYKRLLKESFVNADGEIVDLHGNQKIKTFSSINVDLDKVEDFLSDPSLCESGFAGCTFTDADLGLSGRTATQGQVKCKDCNRDGVRVFWSTLDNYFSF